MRNQIELERLSAELETQKSQAVSALDRMHDATAQLDIATQRNWRTQKFFEQLGAEARLPHYGDHGREAIRVLLLRAQEAGIYTPPTPEHQ